MKIKDFIERVGNIPENAEIWVSSDHGQQEEPAIAINYGLSEREVWLCENCESDQGDACDDDSCGTEWITLGEIPEEELKRVRRVLLWS